MGDLAYVLFLIGAVAVGASIFLYKKKKPIKLSILAGLIGVLLIGISVPTISKEIEEEEKAEQAAAEIRQKEKEAAKREKEEAEQARKEAEANAPIDVKIEKVVNDTLGDKTNTKKDRVHKIEVYGEVANVWLNANENLTVKLTKAGIWSDTFEVIEELAEFNEITLFQLVWMLPLTDTYGNVSDEKVMMLDFPREIIDKINFTNVDYSKASAIAENYWEHNALK